MRVKGVSMFKSGDFVGHGLWNTSRQTLSRQTSIAVKAIYEEPTVVFV